MRPSDGSFFNRVDEIARRRTEGARGISFAETVLGGVRAGVVAADLDDDLAVAADNRRRHRIAIRLAGGDRSSSDGNSHFGRNVLVLEQIGDSGLG